MYGFGGLGRGSGIVGVALHGKGRSEEEVADVAGNQDGEVSEVAAWWLAWIWSSLSVLELFWI